MILENILKVEKIDWREIVPLQSERFKEITGLDSLVESIKRQGFVVPFIVWENGGNMYSIDGYHRKLALEKLTEEGVDVPELLQAVFISAKNKKDAAKTLIAIQPKAAKITKDGFSEFLMEYEIEPQEVDAYAIEFYNEESNFDTEDAHGTATDDDFDPTPPAISQTVLGDLYEIGQHRLLCGDSTDSDAVAKLMNGERFNLFITDPPYGVSYTGKTKDALEIKNDSLSEEQTHELFAKAFSNAYANATRGASIYVTVPPGLLQLGFMKVMHDWGALRQCMVWDKGQMVLGHSDYHYRHEPILYGWFNNGPHYFTSDRTKTTVLEYKKPLRNDEHPTMKPVELWAEMIENSSKPGAICSDYFLGSGTTMVACHQLERKCYGMELDPKYCDVIVNRMLRLDPDLKILKNGKPYEVR